MANYLGEIRLFAGTYAPAGWMLCDGQLLDIMENVWLFNVLGTAFGGDGITTFALPDLRGRVPMHTGPGFTIGDQGGSESVTLNINQIPSHNHRVTASSTASSTTPAGATYATCEEPIYSAAAGGTLHSSTVAATGEGRPHNNMMPYVAVTYIIATQGVFPNTEVLGMPGEIRLFPYVYSGLSSSGWVSCDGAPMSPAIEALLFSVIGNIYGGNGLQLYNLPDLRGRVMRSSSGILAPGAKGGSFNHTLTLNESGHSHSLNAAAGGLTSSATGGVPAGGTGQNLYGGAGDSALHANVLSSIGGGQAHDNTQPYLVLYHAILYRSTQYFIQDPHLGEIRPFPGTLVPDGWARCDGQLLPINGNVALFSLFGNLYGGDGITTFALPDLRGRVAIGAGQGPGLSSYGVGQSGGEEIHTLAPAEFPAHTHTFSCGSRAKGESNSAAGNFPAAASQLKAYSPAPDGATTMAANAVQPSGSAGHNNLQPYLAMTYIISLNGVFPLR